MEAKCCWRVAPFLFVALLVLSALLSTPRRQSGYRPPSTSPQQHDQSNEDQLIASALSRAVAQREPLLVAGAFGPALAPLQPSASELPVTGSRDARKSRTEPAASSTSLGTFRYSDAELVPVRSRADTCSGQHDPNRKDLPCNDQSHRKRPRDEDAAIFKFVPRERVLFAASDDGSPCCTGFSVRHVLLSVHESPYWFNAMQMSTGRMIDVGHPIFHDMRWLRWPEHAEISRKMNDKAANMTSAFRNQSLSQVERKVQLASLPIKPFRGEAGQPSARYHMMLQVFHHSYPGICFSMFIALWAHFYASGLQQQNVTVVLLETGNFQYNEVVKPFLRHMPVAVVWAKDGEHYYAPEMTFAPFGWIDVAEPCTRLFLRDYLVPTVVRNIRRAMVVGRGNSGGPWWPAEYDGLVMDPPEKVMILKTKRAQASKDRTYDIDNATFQETVRRNGFVLLPDYLNGDLRMYFFNHARTIAVNWGAGLTVLAHMFGGGVVSASTSKPVDLIVLYHPNYKHEWQSMQNELLALRGVKNDLREFVEGGVKVRIEPPNSSPWGVQNVYTKIVLLEQIGDLRDSHLRITDAQRAIADDPNNQCRPLRDDEVLWPRAPTGYEFLPPL